MEEIPIKIQRLRTAQDAQKAYCCMNEVPSPWPEALCQCRDWVAQNLGKHFEGYHLEMNNGEVAGHLYYAPSEQALFPYQVEPNVAIIYCEWVQRRYQGQGLGKRLFATFVNDIRNSKVKGILVEATDREGQMHYQHYQNRGFETAHQTEHRRLLYLPLTQPKMDFRMVKPSIQPRKGRPVEIVLLNSYPCPYEAATQMLVSQVAREFGDQVHLRQVWLTPDSLREYGNTRGIFINGRQKLHGGEPEEAIRQAILEEI